MGLNCEDAGGAEGCTVCHVGPNGLSVVMQAAFNQITKRRRLSRIRAGPKTVDRGRPVAGPLGGDVIALGSLPSPSARRRRDYTL